LYQKAIYDIIKEKGKGEKNMVASRRYELTDEE